MPGFKSVSFSPELYMIGIQADKGQRLEASDIEGSSALKVSGFILAVAAVGVFTIDARAAELPLSYRHARVIRTVPYPAGPFPPCVDRWGYVLHCAPRSPEIDAAYYSSTLPLEMTARWWHQPYRQHFTWGR
jgi:hypothetical protein